MFSVFQYFLLLFLASRPTQSSKEYAEFPFYGFNLSNTINRADNERLFIYNTSRIITDVSNDSWFGYSLSGFSREGKSYCLVGSPNYYDDELYLKTGRVYRIGLDYDYPMCSVVPIATSDESRKQHGKLQFPAQSNFLGGSVSAYANRNNEIQLACDSRHLYMPDHSNGTFNDPRLKQIIGTGHCAFYPGTTLDYLPIDACASHEEGSCLAGFSSSIISESNSGDNYILLGLPGSYLTEGNLYIAHFHNRTLISSSRLKSSPRDLKHQGYNLGYAVKLAEINRKNRINHDTNETSYELRYNEEIPAHSVPVNEFGTTPSSNDKYHIITSGKTWVSKNHNDVVMIINQAMDIGGIKYLQDNWGHIGSYFGYSLEVVDLDGNGVADIVVSSPYYTEKRDESQTGSNLKPDIGRVYVFYAQDENGDFGFVYDTENPVILKGQEMISGRFGHALANIGDVDGDGTEDLAVSCPFCQRPNEKNVGSVYIYLGRRAERMSDQPIQIINSNDIPKEAFLTTCGFTFDEIDTTPKPFKAFGWSLSGGIDIDRNKSPDIVIGDYDSRQVVTIKSKSLLWFEEPIWRTPGANILQWSKNDGSYCGPTCRFEVELSVLIRGRRDFINSQNINLLVRVDLDSLVEKVDRKRAGDSSNKDFQLGGPSVIERIVKVDLTSNDGRRITILNLVVEPNLRAVRLNKWIPMVINTTIEPKIDNPTIDWALHPYLGDRNFTSTPLRFHNPECGEDQICHCDLRVRLMTKETQDLFNDVLFYRERNSTRRVVLGLGNFGEIAYESFLKILIPKQLSFTIPVDFTCQIDSESDELNNIVKCSLGSPLMNTGSQYRPFNLDLNTAGAFSFVDSNRNRRMANNTKVAKGGEDVKTHPEFLKINAQVYSGNEDKYPSNNMITYTFKLRLSAKVQLSSSAQEGAKIDHRNFSMPLSPMQKIYPDTIGPEVKHTYLLTNDGPSPIENIQVNLSIPIATKEGEHLLYILDRIRYRDDESDSSTVVDTLPSIISFDSNFNGSCFMPKEFINPLKLTAVGRQSNDGHLRSKRSAGLEDQEDIQSEGQESFMGLESILPNGRKKQQEVIRCGEDFAQLGKPICIQVQCFINKLNSMDAVRIQFRAWIWADTLFRHKISDIGVITEANAQLPNKAFNIIVDETDKQVKPRAIGQSFVFEGIKSLITNEIPLWPIILGILVGAMLLTCIIIAMWKCGFFKRKRWYDHNGASSGVLDSSKLAHL